MPTDTKRKPISEMIVFEEGVDLINDEHILLGTVTLTHRIKADKATLDHASSEEIHRMKADAKRRIRSAIDDKLFGDARLALLRLRDEVDRLFADLKEELN